MTLRLNIRPGFEMILRLNIRPGVEMILRLNIRLGVIHWISTKRVSGRGSAFVIRQRLMLDMNRCNGRRCNG
jgi:hypothetical protein